MDLSIIIVNYNVREYLLKCLKSIFRNTQEISFEVIVVDNASSDDSSGVVLEQFPQVKLIGNQTNLGFARANNQGIKVARGSFILLLNPDTEVIDQGFSRMLKFLKENKKVGIVGPCLLNSDGSLQNTGYKFPTLAILFKANFLGISDHPVKPDKSKQVDWLQGSCLMMKKELLNDIGLLDEDFFIYGEEKDLCFRTKKAGWEIYSLPQCEVIHHANKSAVNYQGEALVEYHRSQLRFFRKYYSHAFVNFAKIIIYLGFLKWLMVGALFSFAFPNKKWKNKLNNFSLVSKWYIREGFRF